jgi:hypothetical protein
MAKLSVGARVALALWAVVALFIWFVSSAGESEFDKQVRVRCEQLGGVFQRGIDGSLACRARKVAKV